MITFIEKLWNWPINWFPKRQDVVFGSEKQNLINELVTACIMLVRWINLLTTKGVVDW